MGGKFAPGTTKYAQAKKNIGTVKWPVVWWNLPSTKGRQFPFVRCGRGMPSDSSEA